MARAIFPFVILLLCNFWQLHAESHEEGFIATEISSKGLDFLKDLLIKKAETSLVPLQLPQIEKSVHIPLLGNVNMVLSGIVIDTINVNSSTVKTGDKGITIDVSGATANMSMNWAYSYKAKLLPISVSDKGNATVQVEGMEVGLTLSLKNVEGSLTLSLLECGCYVNSLSIKLNGGASWLYQGLVDAFEQKIESAVEDAISEKLSDAIPSLDSLLQSLPKQVPVTKSAVLNVTIVDDPVLGESSVDLEISGLFSPNQQILPSSYNKRLLQTSSSCEESDKMVKISVHENVLKSASSVYFDASHMHWTVQKLPNQSLLNTTWWRFVIPQLYKLYPDHDMNLNISVSSLPKLEVKNQQMVGTFPLDVVINVLDDKEAIPVACISIVISTSAFAEITGNSLAGSLKLTDFSMSLNWSNVGDLHINLLQTLASTTLRTLVIPYINVKLDEGFQIPSFHGYALHDAQIVCTDSWIVMCSDVAPVKQSLEFHEVASY